MAALPRPGWRRQDDPPRDDGWLLVSRCHPPSFQCQDSFERGPNMVCLVCYWSQHFLFSSLSQKASMFSTHWGLKMDPNMSGASVGPGLGPGHLYQSDIVRLCIMRISSDMWKLCEGVDKTKITKWHPARVRLTNNHYRYYRNPQYADAAWLGWAGWCGGVWWWPQYVCLIKSKVALTNSN